MAFNVKGLRRVTTDLDTKDLTQFDTSGLKPYEPTISRDIPPFPTKEPPGRALTAASSFGLGLGQIVSGLPKSLALLGAPDPKLWRNLELIDSGERHIPQLVQSGPVVGRERLDPFYEKFYQKYKDGTPEYRQEIRDAVLAEMGKAQKSSLYEAGNEIDRWFTEAFPVNREFQEEFWISKVPQALGSATGFIAAAALTRGVFGGSTVAIYGAPAVLGSAVNRVDQFEDALNSGADIATAFEAANLGALIGVSEAAPIGRLFTRLDKGSGGAIRKYLVRAMRQGTEEGIQEAGAGILNAAVSQGLYAPERGIWTLERTEEGAVGFTTGALLETLFTLAMPGRRRGRRGPGAAEDAETIKPDDVLAFASKRQADLEDAPNLEPLQQQELDMLRDNANNVEQLAEEYGIELEPIGEREGAAATTPPLTQADIDSPIPDDLIQEGHEIVRDALGVDSANNLLEEAELPLVNSQITVEFSFGERVSVTVLDAYEQDGGGVKLQHADGRIQSVPFSFLQEFMVPIEEQADAEEIREDQGPIPGVRQEPERGEAVSRDDLQQAAQARAEARDREAQAAQEKERRAAEPRPELLAETLGIDPRDPINPKVMEGVAALVKNGIVTTMSGDLYGDKLVYIDLQDEVPTDAKLPPGWVLTSQDINVTEADTLGVPLTYTNGSPMSAKAQASSKAFFRNKRIARLGSNPITTEEADALAEALKPAEIRPIEEAPTLPPDPRLRVKVTKAAIIPTRAGVVAVPIEESAAQQAWSELTRSGRSDLLATTILGDQADRISRITWGNLSENDRTVIVEALPDFEVGGVKLYAAEAAELAPPTALPPSRAVEPRGYSVEEYTHTKRGIQMFLVIPDERMEREEFNRMRRAAKSEGGWYSRKWGKTPGGFAFESQEAADEFGKAQFGEAEAAPAAAPVAPSPGGPKLLGDTNLQLATANQIARTSDADNLMTRLGTTALRDIATMLGIDKSGKKPELAARVRQAVIDGLAEAETGLPAVTEPSPDVTIEPSEEAISELQASIPTRDVGTGAEDVQPTAQDRGAGRLREQEIEGGRRPVRAVDEGRAEAAERPAGAAIPEPGREPGVRDTDRVPERGPGAERPAAIAASIKGENLALNAEILAEGRGPTQKARDNIRAIELVREIEAEGRPATHDEQVALARYVGWGGLKGAFPDADGNYGKGFEKVGADLKALLTDTEYATARRSLQYAHFTAENVVNTMWEALRRMGFEGGKVFEPGMGVGNFAGLMPADIAARTDYSGLELDHTTARIARLLYPHWGVRQEDFTKSPLPADTFDVVIGNPPFASIVIQSDPKYPQGFLLHDYFFAKSLDSVRPGGLMAFISSAGTMNKQDAKAREYMADRADLVGAIRLPNNAFKKNAGTEVTTDILFFRKRLPDEGDRDLRRKETRDWVTTVEVTLLDKEGKPRKGHVNRYFQEHPEMVLGEEGFFDNLYPGRYAVRAPAGFDLDAALRTALDTLPQSIMSEWLDPTDRAQIDFGTSERKDGSFYLKDGVLMQQSEGVGRPVQRRGKGVKGGKTLADFERIKGLVPVRDALRAVYAADLAEDTKSATKARKRLNDAYDAFTARFGPINKAKYTYLRPSIVQQESGRADAREEARYIGALWREGDFDSSRMVREGAALAQIARARKAARELAMEAGRTFDEGSFDPADMHDEVRETLLNVKAFMADPESYRLRAIEDYHPVTGKAEKTEVFHRNILSREKKPEIRSVNDALLWTLNQHGRLDLTEVSRLAKVSENEAIEELGEKIYRLLNTANEWVIADEYLSGDVKKKLLLATEAAKQNTLFRRNVEALEAAQPIPLLQSQIDVNLGMPWIPPAIIEQFGTDADGMGLGSLQIKYTPKLGFWAVTGDERSAAATTTWGTENMPAPKILANVLNQQTPIVRFPRQRDGSGGGIDHVATEAILTKMTAMRDAFFDSKTKQGWFWDEPGRATEMAALYNEEKNNLVIRTFDGDYLTTPGVNSKWNWYPFQKRVMARIIQKGDTYMAHAVGSGKTSAMIGSGMEMRRLGLVRKPMYVVPNHMLAQFTKEFYELYPMARIAVADKLKFHTARRKQFIANVVVDDLDAIVITHSAFGLIPVSDQFQDELIQEELDQYRDLLTEPDVKDDRITRGRIEKQIERLEQRLAGKAGRADQVFTFEEMGVDFLFIDEAHEFRKLDFATKMGSLKGIDPQGSNKSWNLYVKRRYLQTINPGRNLVLASGTPITNTMAELYTVSRYLQQDELGARGIAHFDSWASSFGNSKPDLEQNSAGGYAYVTRFSEFVNRNELSKMVRQVMDVVTGPELDGVVVRPKIKGGEPVLHLAEKSDDVVAYQHELAARMVAIKARGKPEPGDDIILNVINDGRHMAIDMRLVDIDRFPNDPGSKLNIMVDHIYDIWEKTKRQPFHEILTKEIRYSEKPVDYGPATQLVFTNLGLGARDFSVPRYIRSELVRRGVPKEQIAYIADYKTHVARQRLFNDMNEGKVRVMIGSVAKMGTGVNVQKRLYASHNLDPLWLPSDNTQRNGRSWRQGNMNPVIEIHNYATKGTYDSQMYGLMGRKAGFVEDFFSVDSTLLGRAEDIGEASQFEQAKAITTADPRLIELAEKRSELEKAQRAQAAFEREKYANARRIASAKNAIEYQTDRIPLIKQDIAARKDTSAKKFKATIKGKKHTERIDFGEAVLAEMDRLQGRRETIDEHKIGTIGGFDLHGSVYTTKSTVISAEGQPEQRLRYRALLEMERAGGYVSDIGVGESALGVVRSMEYALKDFDNQLNQAEAQLSKAKKDVREFGALVGKKFEGQDEITRLTEEVITIETALAATEKEEEAPSEAQPEEPGAPETEEQFSLSPAVIEKADVIEGDLRARLEKVGISDRIALKLVDVIFDKEGAYVMGARGRFANKTIEIALSTSKKRWTLDHEIIHALRKLGLIREAEWKALSRAAKASLKPFKSPETGRTIRRMTEIRRRYKDAELSEEALIEEAVADMHADWAAGRLKANGFIRTAFERIRDFFQALGNAFRGNGFQSASDVFQRIERGEVGARDAIRTKAQREAFQKAFHGTQARFERFRTDKIGTGEGFQAYGWGLYFAENEKVARNYIRAGGLRAEITVDGETVEPPIERVSLYRSAARGELADYIAVNQRVLDRVTPETNDGDGVLIIRDTKVRIADAKALKSKKVTFVEPAGAVYEVRISDEAVTRMLNWDARLSEQPNSVQTALSKSGLLDKVFESGLDEATTPTGGDIYRALSGALVAAPSSRAGVDKAFFDAVGPIMEKYDIPGDIAPLESTTSMAGRILAALPADAAASEIALVNRFIESDPQRQASQALSAAGIPGIKYLDAMSRGVTTGGGFLTPLSRLIQGKKDTRNLVVFDDSIITIKKVDGKRVTDEAFALGPDGPVKRKPVPTFENEDSELRWIEARKGMRNLDTWWQRRMADIDRVKNGFSRHFIELPNEARFSPAREQLRKIEAAPQASKEEVVRTLRQITNGMNNADMDLFTRKVVLDDLTFEVDQQHQLPFGFTPGTVRSELAKLDAVIAGRPDIQEKIRLRQAISTKIANDMVAFGVLHKEQIKNPAYYRHQVLDYARAQVAYAKGPGKKLKTPHWARRMGSRLDINANLLEAEFEWMQKALTDISVAKAITWFKQSDYNVRAQVIANAKAHNERLVDAIIDRDIRANGYTTSSGIETSPIDAEWRQFKQRIAFGLKTVREAIESGEITDIPFEFRSTAQHLLSETQGETSLFPFLAWILDNDKPGSMGAAMAFKAINQRKGWIREHLGEKYADPMQLDTLVKRGFAPPKHTTWQPDEGRLLFTAKTIPEHVVDRMLDMIAEEGAGETMSATELKGALESVRSMLAVGGPKYQMVLPEEVAKSLSSIRDEHAKGLLDAVVSYPVLLWKRWVLINPRRVIKYNLNNLSGDADGVIAGNPRAIKHMPRAIKELWQVMIKGKTPSTRYREAVERGVFDSGLTIQEIPDINYMGEFETLINAPSLKEPGRLVARPFMKMWRGLQRFTWFRENWLRYSAYLDYVERLEGGESMKSIGYGAAYKPMVDAIEDHKDRAALMARELVGDYGAISHFGKGIRRTIYPFYSWLEINTKRYWRLNANAWQQGVGQGLRTATVTGAIIGVRTTAYLYLRMVMLYGMISLWNNLVMGDEEDELGAEARARLHLILGRDDEGGIITLRLQGALSDFLDWLGFDDAVGLMSEIEQGRASHHDLIIAIAKAPVNKVAAGLTPLIKVPLEMLSGQSFWPDAFRPRNIRDKWRHFMRLFSIEHEYDVIFDRPSRGFAQSLLQAVVYRRDIGQTAYGRIKGMAYDWQRRVKGTTGSGYQSPRSTALYNWRVAKRFGDRKAERAAMRRMRELGISNADIRSSIRRAHPLGGLSIKDRAVFLRTLSKREREVLKDAIAWYQETYID